MQPLKEQVLLYDDGQENSFASNHLRKGNTNVNDILVSGGSRISPEVGAPTPRGTPTYDFANFSQKLHEIERIWNGGASLAALDPPLLVRSKLCSFPVLSNLRLQKFENMFGSCRTLHLIVSLSA